MGKFIIVGMAFVGMLFLLNHYAPGAWNNGVTIKGHLIPWAVGAFAVVGYLGYKLKG